MNQGSQRRWSTKWLAGLWLACVGIAAAPAHAGPDEPLNLADGLRSFRNLRSHFRGPRLARVGKLMRKARTGKALRCRPLLKELTAALTRGDLTAAERGPATFVAGLCAEQRAEHARAAAFFAEAGQRYTDMRDEAFFRLGKALSVLREEERAAAAFAEVPATSPRFEEARARWARALAKVQPPDELARKLLRFVAEYPIDREGVPSLPPVSPPPRRQTGALPALPAADAPGPRTLSHRGEITLLLARSLDEAGRPTDAAPHYLYTWARFPNASAGKRAGERLAAMRRTHPKAATPDVYYRFLRGRALLAAGQARAARGVLAALTQELRRKGPAELRWSAELALGVAMARVGDAAALSKFQAVASGAREVDLRGEAAYRAAESAMRRRQTERAIRLYKDAGFKHAQSRLAPLALSDGGELAHLYGRVRDGQTLLQRLVQHYPLHERAARAHWRLGWYAFKANRYEAAQGHFAAVVRSAPRGDEEMRALYWLGRTEALLQKPAEAAAAYRTLAREYPISYYGYLAAQRLPDVVAHDSVAEEEQLRPWVGGVAQHKRADFEDLRLVRAREQLRLGLPDDARRQLRRYEHARERTPGGLMVVASLYRELGLDRRAHWTLRSRAHAFRQHPVQPALVAFWKEAYPRRFVKEIEQAARRAEVPSPLLFGLVREESTFEPRAVSPQNAIGLTQVLWETAQDMARVLKVRLRGRGDLYNPRTNALLGARFLRTLLRTYRGRELLAVAAYNAGPGNVDKWLARRGLRKDGPVPDDEIVEDIPFEETRLYVRKVLGSRAAYGRLYYGERVATAPAPAALHLADAR